MNKTRNTIIIIMSIIIVGCLLYIPQMKDLGLYRDDWNNFYNLTVRGPHMLIEAYKADRPADGYLIAGLYWFFGTNITAYMIWNLCCRILGSVLLALALMKVWPGTSKFAGLAGLLAVAFPGFLQQVDGIAYVPHQTAMLCFMLSLWLMALACEPGQKRWNVLFTFLSILFSFASMMLMEYYIGMEIYRFGLIYLMNREQAGKGKSGSFFRSILSYLPYLIPAAGFVVWRVFFFEAERTGADLIDVLKPYMTMPVHEIKSLAVRSVKSLWKLFAGSWTIPFYNLSNPLGMEDFLKTLLPTLIIFAAAQLSLFLLHRKKTDDSVRDAGNEAAQWLWYGLICGTIAVMPLIISDHDINFRSSLDRFTWPGMLGTILFLCGLLGSLRNRFLRNVLTIAVLLTSIFVQWQNQVKHAELWTISKDYWQQMMWRAPSLKEYTTIVTEDALLVEEDYDVFAPASMIYFPHEDAWSPIGAEVLNRKTTADILLGNNSGRYVREIYTPKDYDHLLAVSKPTVDGCLRIIDGNAPLYSARDYTRIPEVGMFSRLSQIITEPEAMPDYPFFLGKEQEHGWCYYFEKMELALQMADPLAASKLADEAVSKNLEAIDPVEWVPAIEAYTLAGRADDALEIIPKMLADEALEYKVCSYFRAKGNAEDYAEIIPVLCGRVLEREAAGAEEIVSEALKADENMLSATPEEENQEEDTNVQ